jgi:hypothetical protein
VTAHGHVGDNKKHQVNIVEELGRVFKRKIAALELAFGSWHLATSRSNRTDLTHSRGRLCYRLDLGREKQVSLPPVHKCAMDPSGLQKATAIRQFAQLSGFQQQLARHQLVRPARCFNDCVHHGHAQAAFFQLDETFDCAAGGSGNCVFEQCRMMAGFECQLRGTE